MIINKYNHFSLFSYFQTKGSRSNYQFKITGGVGVFQHFFQLIHKPGLTTKLNVKAFINRTPKGNHSQKDNPEELVGP